MSYNCQFCNSSLSSKQKLKNHQETAQYCLKIQGKSQELVKIQEANRCPGCNQSYSDKYNLKRHMKTCESCEINNLTINNTVNNLTGCTINQTINNITINTSKPFTMSDLTREYILERLTPVITKEIVKAGMAAITELIVEVLLQKDGKYCYYCTDKSRKKFVMVIDHQGQIIEEKDPNAQCLRSVLTIPLQTLVASVASKHDLKSIQETYNNVVELKRDGSVFNTTLASALPCDPDGVPECMKARIEAETSDIKALQHLEDMDKLIKKKQTLKKARELCPSMCD